MSRWRPRRKRKRPRHIARAFAAYRRMVMAEDASPPQVEETCQAFFAGAACLQRLMIETVSDGDDVTSKDMAFMAAIQAEIDEFGQDLDRRFFGTTTKEA